MINQKSFAKNEKSFAKNVFFFALLSVLFVSLASAVWWNPSTWFEKSVGLSPVGVSNNFLVNIDFGTGNVLSSKVGAGVAPGNLGDYWNKDGGSVMRFANNTVSSVRLAFTTTFSGKYGATFAVNDKMMGSYRYQSGGQVAIGLTGIPAGTYDFYIYGHGDKAAQAGKYNVTASVNYGVKQTSTSSSVFSSSTWQQNLQYVLYKGIVVGSTGINIQVLPVSYGPMINGIQLIKTISSTDTTCIDSDGGLNYNSRGTTSGFVNGISFEHSDFCTDNGLTINSLATRNLTEYSCSGTSETNQTYLCSYINGCINGACVVTSKVACQRTSNYYGSACSCSGAGGYYIVTNCLPANVTGRYTWSCLEQYPNYGECAANPTCPVGSPPTHTYRQIGNAISCLI